LPRAEQLGAVNEKLWKERIFVVYIHTWGNGITLELAFFLREREKERERKAEGFSDCFSIAFFVTKV